MRNFCHHRLLCIASLLLTFATDVSAQDLTVGNYSLVKRERVGRTEFNYTYRADITNTSSGVQNVIATVTSTSPRTMVVRGTLSSGDVVANTTVTSENAFTVRQDRRVAFDPSVLTWAIQ